MLNKEGSLSHTELSALFKTQLKSLFLEQNNVTMYLLSCFPRMSRFQQALSAFC